MSQVRERVQKLPSDTTGLLLIGTAHFILRAVEERIACENGRESLKVFCHVIMRDHSEKLFGEALLTKAECKCFGKEFARRKFNGSKK